MTTRTITLTGEADDILDFVAMGLASRLTVTVDIEAVEVGAASQNGHSGRVVTAEPIVVGDTVRVIKPGHGCVVGDRGVVATLTKAGRGYSARMNWDDGMHSDIPVSSLERVKKG